MTTGRITADAEAVLSLSVRSPGEANREARFEAVIDTGFNGALTLPAGEIERLGLPEAGEDQVVLGDGRVVTVPTFEALVRFGETTHRFSVEQAPTEPLVGTELLWGYGLRVDFEPGGRVQTDGSVAVRRAALRRPQAAAGATPGRARCSQEAATSQN